MGMMVKKQREELKELHGSRYDQGAVANRVGLSQSVLSDLERGRIAYLPEASTLNSLVAELHLNMAELLQVAGYDIYPDVVDRAITHEVIASVSLRDILRLKYNIDESQMHIVEAVIGLLTNQQPQLGQQQAASSNKPPLPEERLVLWSAGVGWLVGLVAAAGQPHVTQVAHQQQ